MEIICTPKKIQLYINNDHKSITQIKQETGCDIIINGGLYNMSNFQPVCVLKANNQILANDGYKYWGYGWNEKNLILTSDYDKYENYISCICIVRNGIAEPLYIDSTLAASRQRTAIGRTKFGGIWILVQQYPYMSVAELQDYAIKIGLQDALVLDGGLSSQGIFPNDSLIATRNVHNYICIWKEKENENMKDIEFIPITKSDGWKNGSFAPKGIVLHSTAVSGANAYTIQKYFNAPSRGASIHACVDDEHIIQCMPWERKAGHVGSGVNGSFNSSHIGIEMCEPSGIVYNSNGSIITSYNPPKDYFKKVWQNAVDLCVFLCKYYKLNPLEKNILVSHAEAYALGYGSNHGDTAHWFKWENKTMDDFRQAVYEALNPKEETTTTATNIDVLINSSELKKYFEQYLTDNIETIINNYLNKPVVSDPSSWAKEACEKAIAKGVLKGDGTGAYNFQKPLTREAYLVMQDRAGLL